MLVIRCVCVGYKGGCVLVIRCVCWLLGVCVCVLVIRCVCVLVIRFVCVCVCGSNVPTAVTCPMVKLPHTHCTHSSNSP